MVLVASVLDTSFLGSGTLPANATSTTVTFSEPVLNAGTAANYELRRAGADGLLGNTDDPILTISSVNMSGNTATLNFAALPEDVYRLTVEDTITDVAGNALDGDSNGTAGGNWRKDFVVGALTTSLTSPNGFVFDPEFGGVGGGQLVQGNSNSFDGYGRLAVNDVTLSLPATSVADSTEVFAGLQRTNLKAAGAGNWVDVPGLLTNITTDASTTTRLSTQLLIGGQGTDGSYASGSFRFVVDGVPGADFTAWIDAGGSQGWAFTPFSLEDYVSLAAGNHQVKVQARYISLVGTINELNVMEAAGGTGSAGVIRAMEFNASPNVGSSVDSTEVFAGLQRTNLKAAGAGNWVDVPGLLTNITTDASTTTRLSTQLLIGGQGTDGSYASGSFRFVVDGVPGADFTAWIDAGGSQGWAFTPFSLEDYVSLAAGNHQVKVQARYISLVGTINELNVMEAAGGTGSAGVIRAMEFNAIPQKEDSSQTIVLNTQSVASVSVAREVTVPSNSTYDFSRTVDIFSNTTDASISTPVRIVGNLGSDAATTVFATSDGDLLVEPTDLWFGTDDADGTETPAIIHLLHGPFGLRPTSVNVIDDNVEWTYNLTVPAGETRRLASFTVMGTTRAEAIAAANALVTTNGFGGEAAAFLTTQELASLANFQFNTAPTDLSLSANSIAENLPALSTVGSFTTTDTNLGDTFNYSLVSGTGDTDNAQFTIDGNILKSIVPFDFETKSNYSIRVRSTDSGGLVTEKDFTINVTDVFEDVTPPTVSIDDGDADDVVLVGSPMTYTLTFSEDILDGSVTAADFDNAGSSILSIGSITETSAGVFSVTVTPTTAGTVILRIPTGAVITDLAGNNLVVPVQDQDSVLAIVLADPTIVVTSGSRAYNNSVYIATASITGHNTPAPALSFVYYSDASGLNTIAAPENVGSYFVRAFSAANAGNNAAQSAITPFQITPFGLTGNVTAADKAFDGNTSATILTRTLVGVFPGDTVSYIGGTATFDTAAVGNGKTVTATGFSLTGADAGNYTVNTTATTTANITAAAATIANRRVFYNNAPGPNLSSAGAANAAIASDKSPLLPGGSSGFANYTNYVRGLNGLIVDINNLPSTTTDSEILASLQFAQWNGISVGGFSALPGAAIPSATILAGSGAGGSARVKITFPDNSLRNTWLRVTVLANAQTALATDDVFYFGNVVGELNIGNTATRLRVNGQDTNQILLNQSPGANSALVNNIYDVDRNGRVNGQDTNVLLTNQQAAGIVAPITVPPILSASFSAPMATKDELILAPSTLSLGASEQESSNVDQADSTLTTSIVSPTRVRRMESSHRTASGQLLSLINRVTDKASEFRDSKLDEVDNYFATLEERLSIR